MIAPYNIQISNLLVAQSILLKLEESDKTKLLLNLCDRFSRVFDDVDGARFFKNIMRREHDLSTGIGRNIAIPHAVAQNARSLHVLVATHRGIEYDSLDGKPVRIIFMIAIPPKQNKKYSSFLLKISALMSKDDLRHELINAESPREIIALFKKYEELSL